MVIWIGISERGIKLNIQKLISFLCKKLAQSNFLLS